MQRKYIRSTSGCGIHPDLCGVAERLRPRDRSGFSLVEILVVIVIIMLLLSLAATSFSVPISRARDSAERLSAALSMAAAHSASRNHLVWVRIAPSTLVSTDLEIRFYESLDGTNGSPVEFQRPVVLEQIKVIGSFTSTSSNFSGRPTADVKMDEKGVVAFKPTGGVYMTTGSNSLSLPTGSLKKLSEIGLQAVYGKSGQPNPKDVAAVQLRGVSGNPLIYTP